MVRLTFQRRGQNVFNHPIPNPREDLEKAEAEAEAVMDAIIQKNIFLPSSGALIGKRDIKVVGTTTNDLFDPQV